MIHVFTSLVMLMIVCGVCLRHRPGVHKALMWTAFGSDLALLVYVEVSRHAVEKVATGARTVTYVHAALSVVALALYIVMIVLGRRSVRGVPGSRDKHKRAGIAFVVFRSLSYVTAFAA